MPVLGFLPGDDFADVLGHYIAGGDVLQRKNALAMHAGTANLDATAWISSGFRSGFGSHGKTLLT
jgi:1,4-dihydroxy-2-naphthoyl-CoA synthase